MTGLFIIAGVLQIVKKKFSSGNSGSDDQSYAEIAAEYLCDLASGIAGNSAYDKYKEVANRLKQNGLPVNQDIHKIVEKAVLLSGLEATKFCLRQSLEKDIQYKKLLAIEKHIDAELLKINKSELIPIAENPLTDKTEYLDLSRVINNSIEQETVILKGHLADYLIQEKILIAIYTYMPDETLEVPPLLDQCIKNGWEEEGRRFDIFSFACDYFHEFLKTDERASNLIEKQWLCDLLMRSSETKQALQQIEENYKNLGNHLIHTVGRVDLFLNFLNPQPFLSYEVSQLKLHDYTHYRSRLTPFSGRDTEMEALYSFFYHKDKIAWMILSGSGGSGKSRLAMEFCYTIKREKNVLAGFMNQYEFSRFDWINWHVESSCLLILDYAATVIENFKQIIRHLYERQEQIKYPIRFILIERMTEGTEWYKDLKSEFAILKNITPPFLEIQLPSLKKNDLYKIISYLLAIAGKPVMPEKQVISTLNSIDEQGRPLFAILAGIFMSEGIDIKGWNRIQLLEANYAREENIRKKSPHNKPASYEKIEKLVTLVTLAGGLSVDQIRTVISRQHPDLPSDKKEMQLDQYLLFAPFQNENEFSYRPIEPDILGEFFVLKQLYKDTFTSANDEKELSALVDLAWEFRPENISRFIVWIFEDFPTYQNLPLLLLQPPACKEPEVPNVFWTNTIGNIITTCLYRKDWRNATSLYNALLDFYTHQHSNVSAYVVMVSTKNMIGSGDEWASAENIESLTESAVSLLNMYPDENVLWKEVLECVQLGAQYGYNKKNTEILLKYHHQWITFLNQHEKFREFHEINTRLFGIMARQIIRLHAELGIFDESNKWWDHFKDVFMQISDPYFSDILLESVSICLPLYKEAGKLDQMEAPIEHVLNLVSTNQQKYDIDLAKLYSSYITFLIELKDNNILKHLNSLKHLVLINEGNLDIAIAFTNSALDHVIAKTNPIDEQELNTIYSYFYELHEKKALPGISFTHFIQLRQLILFHMGNTFDMETLDQFYLDSLQLLDTNEYVRARRTMESNIRGGLLSNLIKALVEKGTDAQLVKKHVDELRILYNDTPTADTAYSLSFGLRMYIACFDGSQKELQSYYQELSVIANNIDCPANFYANLSFVMANIAIDEQKQNIFNHYLSIRDKLLLLPLDLRISGEMFLLLSILIDSSPETTPEILAQMEQDFNFLRNYFNHALYWLEVEKSLLTQIQEKPLECTPVGKKLFTALIDDYGSCSEWEKDISSFRRGLELIRKEN